ncbi:MAG: hypothetical protein MUF49_31640 [Oculatellaceae cyanobacterium Prado106]|jgi:hypothetical protein|nr:hypothetical protein [Oculatellaceae cyanobacterium Prado106]
MSLDLTFEQVEEIFDEAEHHCPPAISIDRLELIHPLPSQLGNGYSRSIELCPGLELSIFHETYQDLTVREPEKPHLIQFKVLLSGIEDSGDHVLINAEQSYIGGSGMQRSLTVFMPRSPKTFPRQRRPRELRG